MLRSSGPPLIRCTDKYPADLAKTFAQALASGKTALIDVKTDKDCPTPVYYFVAGVRAWSFH